MNKTKITLAEYKRFKIYKKEGVVRIYFSDRSCISLSIKKNSYSLLRLIINQIKITNLKQRNLFVFHKDYVEVVCYQIKTRKNIFVKVDYETYEKIKECHTSVNSAISYAQTYIRELGNIRLHNFITNFPEKEGKVVDHINHDTFDDRLRNLRVCTPQDNSKNKSFFSSGELPVTGLSYNDNKNKIRVRIGRNSKQVLFDLRDYKKAVIYCYNKKIEKGYLFKESSTTIEKYIQNI